MSFQLRPYQTQAVEACVADLSSNDKVLIVLPTGGGKTEIFINVAAEWIKQNPGKSVLILSHLSILTEQTKERFKLRQPHLRVGIFKQGSRPDFCDDVIIGTMQTARNLKKLDALNKRLVKPIGMVIVDEAHYIWTSSYLKIIEHLSTCKIVGCTATPFRKNKLMTNYFQKVSYNISMGELIEQGYLVKPNIIVTERIGDKLEDIMAQVIATYRDYENGKQAIVFMRNIRECQLMATAFREAGFSAEAITSRITGKTRDNEIARYNGRHTNVLVSCDVLTAGFDSPCTSAIFQPYVNRSVTRYLQRVGRSVRTCSCCGKQSSNCYVYSELPDLRNGYFHRLHAAALKENGRNVNYETFLEEHEFLGEDAKEYIINLEVVKAIRSMQKIGMDQLADMMNHRQFPERFMGKIDHLLKRLPQRKIRIPHHEKKATDNQIIYLENFSFPKEKLETLSRGEANMLIRTIKGPPPPEYTIPTGRFQGYHVAELPFTYRQYMLDKFPMGPISAIIRKYNLAKIRTA